MSQGLFVLSDGNPELSSMPTGVLCCGIASLHYLCLYNPVAQLCSMRQRLVIAVRPLKMLCCRLITRAGLVPKPDQDALCNQ